MLTKIASCAIIILQIFFPKAIKRTTFDERQKRINEALEYDVQPSIVKQYETLEEALEDLSR